MSQTKSREETIFNAAAGLATPAERAAFLDRECAGDVGLRSAVETLLRASDEAGGSFLGKAPVTMQPGATIALPPASGTIALPPSPGGTIMLGEALAPPATTTVTLPPEEYLVGGEIARGGMGSILEAEDRKLGRKVAMKVMKLEASASDYARARFVREATVLARLEHPNIVPIHELGWDAENRLFYTMKLVQGRTLQAVINGLKERDPDFIGHYTLDRLLTIFRKICDALSMAHAKGVIHRDLKPENVMVGEFGEVLVMDWGIAKILGDAKQTAEESWERRHPAGESVAEHAGGTPALPGSGVALPSGFQELSEANLKTDPASLTMDGTIMGTPHYMSPEQADGRVTEIDQQSDVFSLGAILYALITLHTPVEADSPYEVLELIKRGEIRPPTTFNLTTKTGGKGQSLEGAAVDPKKYQPLPHCPAGKVPPALSAVTMRALTVDKARRYPTVAAFAADIEKYQSGFATSAEEAGLFTQLRLLVQRHRREFAVGGAAALVLVIFTVWFVINLRAKERRAIAGEQKAIASEAMAKSEAERATKAEKVAVDRGEAARRALAKAQIALADSAFRNADHPGLVQALEACPADLREQSWQYLAAKRDSSLRPVEFSAVKNPIDVLAVPGRPGHFVLAGKTPTIAIVDVAGGDRVVQTFATGTSGTKALAISGDGRVLAVSGRKVKNRSDTVLLFDVATGALRKELTLPVDAGGLALNRDGTRLAASGAGDGCAMLDTADGRTLWRFKKRVFRSTFSPDGSRLVTSAGGVRRQLDLLRAENGEVISSLDASVSSQAVSADGKWIAVGTPEGDCYVLDGATGAVLTRGHPFTGKIYSVAFTSDNHLLASGEEGKFSAGRWGFRLLDPEKLSTVGTFFGLQPGVQASWSLHPGSGELLTADNPPRLWRLPVGLELVKFTHYAEQATSGCFLSDTVLLARKDFNLMRYDLATPGKAVERGQPFNNSSCASHWSSGIFVLGAPSAKPGKEREPDLKVFALEDGKAVEKPVLAFQGQTQKLTFDASGERLAAVGRGGVLEVIDVKSGRSLFKAPGSFESAVFAGAGRNLIAVNWRGRTVEKAEDLLTALDGTTGAVLGTVTNRFRVNALAASPDGKLVAIAGSDQMVHLFDAATLAEKSSFRAHDGEITALAFHPTLPVIATAAMDRSVKLWEHGTARMVEQFLGLGGTPVVLAFNPSGTLLLVDGQERTTRVFDVSGAAKAGAAK